jgi:ELWxxDGT repeat protein
MVKDIWTGANDGFINSLMVMNNKLYFNATDGTNGEELWVSDGTAAGTTMVKDIWTGAAGSYPTNLAVHNNKLYFRASDGTNGYEPWISDGTAAGTVMLKDINTGSGSSLPLTFVSYKKYMYFIATPASGPQSIYQTNGTAAGTISVAPASFTGALPLDLTGNFYMYDSTLYFSAAYNSAAGQELWSMEDTTTYGPPPGSVATINKADIALYPNPTHHNFTIKTTTPFKAGSITLTDVTGRVVKTEKLYNNMQTISLQGIAPGIYTADVWLDDKRSTQKLIVQ